MLLSFVDESNHGDFHGFAAVVADEYSTKSLTGTLNAIMRHAGVDWGLDCTTEFHAYPMFHGKEVWSAVPARARVGLFHKVVDAIVDEPVVLILRSVNETRLRERQTKNYYPSTSRRSKCVFNTSCSAWIGSLDGTPHTH